MNKVTAQQLLLAYAEVQDAQKRVEKRLGAMTDKEADDYPNFVSDIVYFSSKLREALDCIEHRVADAKEVI